MKDSQTKQSPKTVFANFKDPLLFKRTGIEISNLVFSLPTHPFVEHSRKLHFHSKQPIFTKTKDVSKRNILKGPVLVWRCHVLRERQQVSVEKAANPGFRIDFFQFFDNACQIF